MWMEYLHEYIQLVSYESNTILIELIILVNMIAPVGLRNR